MSQILGSINDHMSACMNTLTHTFFRSSRTQTCKIQVPILFWAKLPLDSMFRSTFLRPVGFWSTTWPVYILDWWPAISYTFGSCLRSQKESTWAYLLTCNFLMCVFHTASFCSNLERSNAFAALHITYSLTRIAGLKLWQFNTHPLTVPINIIS